MAYTEWDTHSNGRHFHLIIKGLQALTEKERILYRLKVIQEYGSDPAKKNGWIAMENRPHIKSHKLKTLVKEVTGTNYINMDYVNQIKQELKPKLRLPLKPNQGTFEHDAKALETKYTISQLWQKWGMSRKGNRWDTPFATSKSKACVSINDDKGVWYDFNTMQGGNIYTAVMLKFDCGFSEAVNRIGEDEL